MKTLTTLKISRRISATGQLVKRAANWQVSKN